MVLLLAMISAAAASPPPVKVVSHARASIVVLQPHRASAQTWSPASSPNQREVRLREADGRETKIRLTEFE
jgi:hypothetical protein